MVLILPVRGYGNTIPPATPTPVVTVRYGDVNGDDEVDSTDLTLLRGMFEKIDDFPIRRVRLVQIWMGTEK